MGCVAVDQLLPLTIWSKGCVKHRISCIAITPNNKYLVTGSWDGNCFIWSFDLKTHSLKSRWVVTGQGSGVSAIACFNSFFIAFLQDGAICHFQLSSGYLLNRREDPSFLHTIVTPTEDGRVICAGFYPDLVVIDAYTLEITAMLQSRVQSDWVSCLRTITGEGYVHVQGLTVSGVLKTWSLNDLQNGVSHEISSSTLNVPHCIGMAFDMKRRYLLIVTYTKVTVFDYGVSIIFKHDSKQTLEGGDFLGRGIVFWTKKGDLFYCDITDKHDVVRLIEIDGFEVHVPNNLLLRGGSAHYYYIVSDINGHLNVWRLETEPSVSAHFVSSIDASKIADGSKGLLDYLNVRVTCSTHITDLNKFVAGCSDGSLLVFSATDVIMSHFFLDCLPDYFTLLGHRESVHCILYPHTERSSFSESLLISGGDDYCIYVWDIFKRELLHKFCVHSGPVVQLMVPPADCHSRIANSICSVSSDHSVAIISLRERHCIFFASQHPFSIVAIRWKASHDFMIVKCFDGTVFVWELKTGILDRILCGIGAEEVVYCCDNVSDDVLWDFYTKELCVEELNRKPFQISDSKDKGPLQIRGMLSTDSSESFILLINVSSFIFHLEAIFPEICEEQDISSLMYSLTVSPDSGGFQKKLTNVIDAIMENGFLQDKFHFSSFQASSKQNVIPQRKVSATSGLQLIPWAQIVMSLLHLWQKNSERDLLCKESLGLLQTKMPISFDLSSSASVISLRNPLSGRVTRTWFDYVAMCALARTLRGLSFSESTSEVDSSIWEKLVSFNHPSLVPDFLSLEKLAFLWQCSSYTLRTAVRKILPQCLLSLNKTDSQLLLEKWRIFLPTDSYIRDSTLASVAISLVGVLTIDGDVRSERFDTVLNTCDSIRGVIASSSFEPSVQATAIDILGRGYLVWESVLPVDETLVLIFDRCSKCTDFMILSSARETLRIVARNRLSQFVALLKLMCKTGHPSLERSKTEIISVLRSLLVEFPWGLSSLLSDVIEVLLSCIDPSHLKSSELFCLLPGIGKVDQVHHCVSGQRIAVGMPDGKVVVHDLRTHRCHVFLAHNEMIRLVRFSCDGKLLVTISSAGYGAVWQLSHGLFGIGVGQFRFRPVKKFEVPLKVSEKESGVIIDWTDVKTLNIISVEGGDSSPLSTIHISI